MSENIPDRRRENDVQESVGGKLGDRPGAEVLKGYKRDLLLKEAVDAGKLRVNEEGKIVGKNDEPLNTGALSATAERLERESGLARSKEVVGASGVSGSLDVNQGTESSDKRAPLKEPPSASAEASSDYTEGLKKEMAEIDGRWNELKAMSASDETVEKHEEEIRRLASRRAELDRLLNEIESRRAKEENSEEFSRQIGRAVENSVNARIAPPVIQTKRETVGEADRLVPDKPKTRTEVVGRGGENRIAGEIISDLTRHINIGFERKGQRTEEQEKHDQEILGELSSAETKVRAGQPISPEELQLLNYRIGKTREFFLGIKGGSTQSREIKDLGRLEAILKNYPIQEAVAGSGASSEGDALQRAEAQVRLARASEKKEPLISSATGGETEPKPENQNVVPIDESLSALDETERNRLIELTAKGVLRNSGEQFDYKNLIRKAQGNLRAETETVAINQPSAEAFSPSTGVETQANPPAQPQEGGASAPEALIAERRNPVEANNEDKSLEIARERTKVEQRMEELAQSPATAKRDNEINWLKTRYGQLKQGVLLPDVRSVSPEAVEQRLRVIEMRRAELQESPKTPANLMEEEKLVAETQALRSERMRMASVSPERSARDAKTVLLELEKVSKELKDYRQSRAKLNLPEDNHLKELEAKVGALESRANELRSEINTGSVEAYISARAEIKGSESIERKKGRLRKAFDWMKEKNLYNAFGGDARFGDQPWLYKAILKMASVRTGVGLAFGLGGGLLGAAAALPTFLAYKAFSSTGSGMSFYDLLRTASQNKSESRERQEIAKMSDENLRSLSLEEIQKRLSGFEAWSVINGRTLGQDREYERLWGILIEKIKDPNARAGILTDALAGLDQASESRIRKIQGGEKRFKWMGAMAGLALGAALSYHAIDGALQHLHHGAAGGGGGGGPIPPAAAGGNNETVAGAVYGHHDSIPEQPLPGAIHAGLPVGPSESVPNTDLHHVAAEKAANALTSTDKAEYTVVITETGKQASLEGALIKALTDHPEALGAPAEVIKNGPEAVRHWAETQADLMAREHGWVDYDAQGHVIKELYAQAGSKLELTGKLDAHGFPEIKTEGLNTFIHTPNVPIEHAANQAPAVGHATTGVTGSTGAEQIPVSDSPLMSQADVLRNLKEVAPSLKMVPGGETLYKETEEMIKALSQPVGTPGIGIDTVVSGERLTNQASDFLAAHGYLVGPGPINNAGEMAAEALNVNNLNQAGLLKTLQTMMIYLKDNPAGHGNISPEIQKQAGDVISALGQPVDMSRADPTLLNSARNLITTINGLLGKK